MKPETIDLLLDCYIKERIPNADDILTESAKDCHTISFAPVPPSYQGISFAPVRPYQPISFAPVPPSCQPVLRSLGKGESRLNHELCGVPEGQSFSELNLLPSVDAIDGLPSEEMQKCKTVAKKLVKIAEQFEDYHMNSCRGRISEPLSDEHERGCTPDEQLTLERIYSEGASQGVSRIASILTNCFTPQTLKGTIRYLSGQNDDVSQQLAVTFELSSHIVRLMGGRVMATIRDVVVETFQNLDGEVEDL